MPAIHAGMTNSLFSCFVGERKIMNHFVVNKNRWDAAIRQLPS